MTSKDDFTDEEWARLGRAPLVAGAAISLADPGGPIEAFKETAAAIRALIEAARDGGHGAFVQSVARDAAAKAERHENPMAGFTIDRQRPVEDILDELRAVNALLAEKAAPEEVDDFREWIRMASQRVALAAKEGGFLGVGAERVSEREQQMLETIGQIFGVPPSDAAARHGDGD
jgi:hypothetical protein